MLLNILPTGKHGDADVDERTQRLYLSIAQVIAHAVSKGQVLTTKHIRLGMTIHQATRSNDRVNLFHKASTV